MCVRERVDGEVCHAIIMLFFLSECLYARTSCFRSIRVCSNASLASVRRRLHPEGERNCYVCVIEVRGEPGHLFRVQARLSIILQGLQVQCPTAPGDFTGNLARVYTLKIMSVCVSVHVSGGGRNCLRFNID